jgi:NADH pyrophosphatase NudC (nudix superfamily)
MNKKRYHNQYYIYEIKQEYQDRILEIRDNNMEQQKEISDIKWVSIKESKEYLRPYFYVRRNMIESIKYMLMNRKNE